MSGRGEGSASLKMGRMEGFGGARSRGVGGMASGEVVERASVRGGVSKEKSGGLRGEGEMPKRDMGVAATSSCRTSATIASSLSSMLSCDSSGCSLLSFLRRLASLLPIR